MDVSATTKTQRKMRRMPRLSVSERVPKVRIGVSLTACRVRMDCGRLRSAEEGGTTLTCAPVSTKKRRPVLRSVM